MARRDAEYDAAYFTLLRAYEERDDLLRYQEYLHAERQRLETFAVATRDLAEPLARRIRRPIDATTKGLLEAVGRRRATVLDELGRVGDRLAAAEDFVAECEQDVARLRT
jgi:hypothetical protein